ncbi:MAG: ATP-binding protein [Defluviitaleaceae bacterium]|nr:ATP-binding protein [Defluviitaleaceae bacterium]
MKAILDRNFYTNSKEWPIVPFSLQIQDDSNTNKVEWGANVGLSKEHIKGWSMSISEVANHPALIWTKKYIGYCNDDFNNGMFLNKIETEKFYPDLSPICFNCKKNIEGFRKNCDTLDETVVKRIFNYIDKNEKNDVIPIIEYNVDINIKRNDEKIVCFMYTCPYLPLIELIFPVIFEGIAIALVMVGQIVINENYDKLINLIKPNKDILNIFSKKNMRFEDVIKEKIENINETIKNVSKEVESILLLYSQQIEGARKRILDEALNRLTKTQKRFSLYGNSKFQMGTSALISRNIEIKNKIIKFFRSELVYLENLFGVEHIYIYFDDNLKTEVNEAGVFYQRWLRDKYGKYGERKNRFDEFNGVNGVIDLFHGFNSPPPKRKLHLKNLAPTDYIPSDNGWTICIYENSIYVDDAGIKRELPPIIIGIKYKNGKLGRDYYLGKFNHDINIDKRETDWIDAVLPKFAIFARNVLLAWEKHKQSDALMEGKLTLEHEFGNMYRAMEGFTELFEIRRKNWGKIFENITEKLKAYLVLSSSHVKSNEIMLLIEDLNSLSIRDSEHFESDVLGLFLRIKMVSYFHNDKLIPDVKPFDVADAFLEKWKRAFNYLCRPMRKWNEIIFSDEASERKIKADPVFLEHATYNVIVNAIKYAKINTCIYAELVKTNEGNSIIITNYGDYLEPNNKQIYERGKRNLHKSLLFHNNVNKEHTSGRDKSVDGKGIGLYLCHNLLKSMNCEIYHKCKFVSNYNIALINLFLERYRGKPLFKEFWDEMAEKHEGLDVSYDAISKEYNELIKSGKFSKVVNEKKQGDMSILENMESLTIFEQIQEMTFETKFIITIPFIKENENENKRFAIRR